MTNTNVGNNQWLPGESDVTYNPDQLIAGQLQLITETKVITGAAAYARGTVMGKVTLGAVTSAAKQGGNTGTGTCVVDAVQPLLANATAGIYTLTCILAGANSATFRLSDPKGVVLGDFAFNGAGASFTTNDRIKVAVTDAATDFVVGDAFNITVAAGSGAYKKAVKTAVDGSQTPARILVDAIDVTSADKNGGVYSQGQFNINALTYDASFSAADIQAAFENTNIFIMSANPNSAPN